MPPEMPEPRALDWRHDWEIKSWDPEHWLVQCVSKRCLRNGESRVRQMYLVPLAEISVEVLLAHRTWKPGDAGSFVSEHPLRGRKLTLIPLQMEIACGPVEATHP